MVLPLVFKEVMGNSQVVILHNFILSLALIKVDLTTASTDSAIGMDYPPEPFNRHERETEGVFPVVQSDVLVE